MKKQYLFFLMMCFMASGKAQTVDINNNWDLWLDKSAKYENDQLFLPPYDVTKINVNEPTCGWSNLDKQKNIYKINIPATVEQYAWGINGNDHGICGDYVGVSWFSKSLDIKPEWKKKKIFLNFKSARMRAEVYVNKKLVGYEIINGTPFSVDVSEAVNFDGGENELAVRVTDPNGNFAWRDWDSFMWGNYETPPSHGFGGITGDVSLEVKDNSFIDDIYIKNNPQYNKITTQVSLANLASATAGRLIYTIKDKKSNKKVWQGEEKIAAFSNDKKITKDITIKNANLWSPDSPNLYELSVEWIGDNGDKYCYNDNFGFRWFEVKIIDGDRMFLLNGKRVILHTAISWGHWPVNGIIPTKELAEKQIKDAKRLGMNMLNFHRGISQESVLDLADELGLMIYEEPGGYKPGNSDFAKRWKQEKLMRMVKRDRNHPSLVIYSMINEAARNPQESEIKDIKMAHEIDPSRCITYTSTYFGPKFYNGKCPITPTPVKMHMLPNDTTVYYQGWWDEHHAGGPGVYKDDFYNSKDDFLRYKKEKDEIIFYGEEGAIGTPPRLQLIKNEIQKTGLKGWNGDDMLRQYNAFDEFLTDNNFKGAFPCVDSLCVSLGNVAYYYQGRMIENVYISNNIDGWATNGWESTKIENHSGIVDLYRNFKGDPNIISYYNQPCYVAIKAKKKVLNVGETTNVDFYMVNRVGLKGNYKLNVYLKDDKQNKITQLKSFNVNIKGGNCYGQLIKENIIFSVDNEGYSYLYAKLLKDKEIKAKGTEKIFATKTSNVNNKIFVADTSGVVQKILNTDGINFKEAIIKDIVKNENAILMVGAEIQPGVVNGNFRQDDPLIEWIERGGKMIIINNAANWCKYLELKEVADYRGSRTLDKNWFGGNFFVKNDRLFDGLPQATAFNWEYQCFAGYNSHREGLRLANGNCIVGCYADHKNEMFSTLSVLPVGKGMIIVSTLDFEKAKNNPVACRLLQNIINY